MSRSRSRSRSKGRDQFARSLGGPLNASPEEAAEMAKNSKRENRVYVGNLSYEVRYRDLMEFMRGGGLGDLISLVVFGFSLDICLVLESSRRRRRCCDEECLDDPRYLQMPLRTKIDCPSKVVASVRGCEDEGGL